MVQSDVATHMAEDTTSATPVRCAECGFEAEADSGTWTAVDHPPLGTLTQCPECEGTNVVRL